MRQWEKTIGEKQHGKTLEQVLREEGFSKKEISRLKFKTPGLLLDGKQCRSTESLKYGQKICLHLEDEKNNAVSLEHSNAADERLSFLDEEETFSQSSGPLFEIQILYEDQDLLIVNKPSGLPCHPCRGHYDNNLGTQIQKYCSEKNEICQIRLIGRLDKDTSGAVVYAKNQAASARLWKQRENGHLHKRYYALVHGFFETKQGTIDAPIGECTGVQNQMHVADDGKRAITNYQVLQEYVSENGRWSLVDSKNCLSDNDKRFSLVMCTLQTGRTHQIRVHMAHLGHPVAGDKIYGKRDAAERLCLHAEMVELYQPFTKEQIIIEIPVKGIPF